jgi:integrase
LRAPFLSPEQVEALAHVLDGHPPYGLLIRFIAYTGLRAGEVAGLNVGDVLLGRVQVHRTRDKVRGGWREGTPKSEASTRLVPLPPWLREELGRYLANEHPNGSDAASPLWPGRHRYPDLLTKGTLDWSEPWERDCFYRSAFKPALLRAGLPASVRLHDLRHTYASICASAGIPPYRVAAYLGHAQVTTTLSIYTHLFDADSTDDMDRLARPDSRGARASATLIGMRSI